MSKFTIYSPDNTPLYTGTPTYTGSYRKPGMLEFRDVSVPEYIDFAPGCYVGYESGGSIVPEYSRTGYAYKIYTVPQVKKQARSGSYGAAFVYQSVQLFDASKDLEYCPFRDLVKGDNRIHFSTQPSISTFESLSGATGVEAGLAARFQACLEDMYGAGSWVVRTATVADGASPTLLSLMADAREFTVSGVNLLEALDKVYDIWPEVGWVYRVENGVNTIVIGGAGLDANSGTYRYGKGNGLKSLTRTVANADELANRIFAYGSQRNMTSDWYRRDTIKDSSSVDIQHLMIPVSEWGQTGGKYDAAKAYVEDGGSIDRRGLRLRTAYFDGTEDLPEIYPTIEGMTIQDVRNAGPDYIPNARWSDPNARVDMVYDAEPFDDEGYSGSSGQSRLLSLHFDVPAKYTSGAIDSSLGEYASEIFKYELEGRRFAVDIEAAIDFTGTVTVQNASRVWTRLEMTTGSDDELKVWAEVEIAGTETELGSGVWNVKGGQVNLGGATIADTEIITITAFVYASLAQLDAITPDEPTEELEESLVEEEEPVIPEYRDITIITQKGSGHIYETVYRSKTFRITLRQIGFDIAAQGDFGDGKVISMRSGQCQGRSFAIKDAILDIEHDTWELECYRSEDESLGQWFPNAIYPVRGAEQNYPGDEFVLLDIAMPDSYIRVAENKLYNAALSLLSDTATERWQYTPEIDAKFMVENSRTIRPAENMTIVGVDIVEGDAGFVYLTESTGSNLQTTDGEDLILDESGYQISVLVDTVVISEGESAIPTYKVTLLDRKRKVFTESKSVSEYTARSVANAKQVETSRITTESSFFELCDDGSVKLKEKYIGLWADGWMAAGGVQSDGEGGGGGGGGGGSTVTVTQILTSGTRIATITVDGTPFDLYAPSGGGTDVAWGTKVPDYSRVLTVAGTSETVLLDGALGPLTAAVNAIDWFTVVTVDDEPTLRLNPRYAGMWADGWVAAGGVGSSGGGGGGAGFLYQLGDVSIPNPPNEPNNGDLLVYNTTTHRWENKPQSSIVPDLTTVNNRLTALEGSVTTINGQITALQAAIDAIDWFIPTTVTIDGVSTSTLKLNPIYAGVWAEGWVSAGGVGSSGGGGGSTVSVQNLADTTAQESRIAKITVDGIETYLYNDVAWGTYSQSDKTIGLTINGTTRTICLDGYAGGSSTLAGLDDVSVGLATSTDLLTYTGGVWVPLSRSSLLSGYIPLSGSTAITGTLGASGWSITKGGVAEFNTIQGKGSNSLYIGHSDDSIDGFIYIQEDTYLKNEAIMGGTSNSASENKWIIEPDGSAEFTSVVIIDGTTKEPLEGFLKADGSLDTTEYVTIETTQTITGTKTFSATNLYAKNILPSSGSLYNLGSTSARWATLYAVDANLTGDLTMSANKHIDIGPLRIEYDSNAKALHITKASSSDTQNYGIYADGFVAAGGIQS